MIGRGLNGSALGLFAAGSGKAANGGASGNVIDLSNFESGLLVAFGASPNAIFNVTRSSTSNGTFGSFGASLTAAGGSGISSRYFVAATSNVWHQVTFENNAGSITYTAMLIGQGARQVPITQQGNTVNYSDVAAAL